MKKKLTIDLSRMSKGWNGITKNHYDYCIYADPKSDEMYEIQLIKLNFPSTKASIKEMINEKRLTQ